jgi:hypothetical protein
MATLTGYFDAAGDNSGRYAVTVGGYVAPVRNWSRYQRDWRKVLDPLGIDVFHMTDFMAGQGDFEAWRGKPEKQMAVLMRLAKVIVRHAHFSSATTVVLDDWRAANTHYTLKECHATPYCLAAFSSLSKAIKWIGRERGKDLISEFVFEEGDSGFGDLLQFMNWARKAVRPGALDCVYPIPKPKTLEPLQAADFTAWEQRYVAAKRSAGEIPEFRPSLRALMTVRNDWGVIDGPKLVEYCEWLGVPKRAASQRVSQKERARWRPLPLRKAETKRGGGHR